MKIQNKTKFYILILVYGTVGIAGGSSGIMPGSSLAPQCQIIPNNFYLKHINPTDDQNVIILVIGDNQSSNTYYFFSLDSNRVINETNVETGSLSSTSVILIDFRIFQPKITVIDSCSDKMIDWQNTNKENKSITFGWSQNAIFDGRKQLIIVGSSYSNSISNKDSRDLVGSLKFYSLNSGAMVKEINLFRNNFPTPPITFDNDNSNNFVSILYLVLVLITGLGVGAIIAQIIKNT